MKRHIFLFGLLTTLLAGTTVAQVDFLMVRDGFGNPGEAITTPIEIVLANSNDLRGIQFELEYDPALLTVNSISGVNRLSAMEVRSNEAAPGRLAVLVADLGGAEIVSGSEPVLVVNGSIASGVEAQAVAIGVRNIAVSNTDGQALVTAGGDGFAFVSGANFLRVNNGHQKSAGDTVSVDLYNPVELGGLQMTLRYPADLLLLHSVEKTTRSADFDLNANLFTAGELVVTLTSTQADSIKPGAGPLLRFVVDTLETSGMVASGTHAISVDHVVLSGTNGEATGHTAFGGAFFLNRPMLPVSVADATIPERFVLSQNYPNPFNPETQIDFDMPSAAPVTISIYNLLGRKVRTLLDEFRDIGQYSVSWDGRSGAGEQVGSGVYLIEMRAGEFVSVRRASLVR